MRFIILTLFLFQLATLCAQTDTLNLSEGPELQDTTTKEVKRNTFKTIFRGNPGRAAFYSLVIPAGGQIYNKKWWKVPLALGIEAGTMTWAITSRQQFKKFDNIWQDLNNGIIDNEFNFTKPSDVVSIRSRARQQMEYSWVFILVGKLVTVFDAYVDRHLIEFDISEDLSGLSNLPSFNIRIPLNPKAKQKAFVTP